MPYPHLDERDSQGLGVEHTSGDIDRYIPCRAGTNVDADFVPYTRYFSPVAIGRFNSTSTWTATEREQGGGDLSVYFRFVSTSLRDNINVSCVTFPRE